MAHAFHQRSDHDRKENPITGQLVDMRIIEAIPTIGSISLADLSNITSSRPDMLRRLLRVAVVTGFLNHSRTGGYAHTASSLQHTSGCSALLDIFDDEDVLAGDRALGRKQLDGFASSMEVIDGAVLRQDGVGEARGKVLFANQHSSD